MIVFNIDKLDDFIGFLPRRLNDEVYYAIQNDIEHYDYPPQEDINVTLHFLGKVNEQHIALYQTNLKFSKKETKEKIYSEMKKVFETANIALISGSIMELYLSSS